MIQLNQISLQRGGNFLIESASLTIHPGQRFAIVGNNGCGKSSLFSVLLGKLSLDTGEMIIGKHLRIAHMAQEIHATDRPAREYIIDGHTELRELQQQLTQAESDDDGNAIALIHSQLDALGAYTIDFQAESIMQGLGFSNQDYQRTVGEFSGGWRIRLNLARTLLRPSDILLLDEPTNHLDIEAIHWLELWLKNYQGSVLLISHDRDFIDSTVQHIAHFDNKTIKTYTGSYSDFERQRAENLLLQQSEYEKQQATRAHLEDFIRRFKAKASKAKQAQSRVKALEKMQTVAAVRQQSPYQFTIDASEKISSPLVNWFDTSVGFDSTAILQKCNFSILPGMRIGLLGRNGAGKSTLMKTLANAQTVLSGEVTEGEHLRIGYFAQHQLEYLDLQASALLHLQRLKPEAREQEILNFLGKFKIQGDMALKPITPFSGGEKARLALAIIAWLKPNLLLLDEPTNHLDIEMREALAEALQLFEGAVMLVSHDRYLLRHCIDEFWLVDHGSVTPFPGDLNDYYALQAQQTNSAPSPNGDSNNKNTVEDKKAKRQEAAQIRQQLAPLKKLITKYEKAASKNERQLTVIRESLGDSSLYEIHRKNELQKLLHEEQQLSIDLTSNENAWFEALERLEIAES